MQRLREAECWAFQGQDPVPCDDERSPCGLGWGPAAFSPGRHTPAPADGAPAPPRLTSVPCVLPITPGTSPSAPSSLSARGSCHPPGRLPGPQGVAGRGHAWSLQGDTGPSPAAIQAPSPRAPAASAPAASAPALPLPLAFSRRPDLIGHICSPDSALTQGAALTTTAHSPRPSDPRPTHSTPTASPQEPDGHPSHPVPRD